MQYLSLRIFLADFSAFFYSDIQLYDEVVNVQITRSVSSLSSLIHFITNQSSSCYSFVCVYNQVDLSHWYRLPLRVIKHLPGVVYDNMLFFIVSIYFEVGEISFTSIFLKKYRRLVFQVSDIYQVPSHRHIGRGNLDRQGPLTGATPQA